LILYKSAVGENALYKSVFVFCFICRNITEINKKEFLNLSQLEVSAVPISNGPLSC